MLLYDGHNIWVCKGHDPASAVCAHPDTLSLHVVNIPILMDHPFGTDLFVVFFVVCFLKVVSKAVTFCVCILYTSLICVAVMFIIEAVVSH